MPEWLFDFLSGPTIKIAAAIWNSSMKLIIKLVCSTPQKFSTGTWAFVKENLYPWAEGIGLSALNLFFMIAFLKAVSNLHQNITLEMVIEAMIKVVVANVLYLNILNIMTTIFSISSAMAKEVFTIDAPDLKVEDIVDQDDSLGAVADEKELSQELLKFLEKEGEERRNFYAVSVESTGEKDYKAVLDFSTKRSDGKNISITFENGIYTFAFK